MNTGSGTVLFTGEAMDFALPEACGVMRYDNRVVFVSGLLPGESARVAIVRRKKRLFLGEVVERYRSSPFRIEPPCVHYRSGCGGCSLQEIAYPEQVRIKERHARETMHRLGRVDWNTVVYEGFTPSPLPFEYRNKMEFNFGIDGDSLVLGLRPRGRWWEVVDLSSCCLMNQDLTGRILRIFRDYGQRHALPGYDPVGQVGVLRNLLVRYSEKENGVLIGLFTVPLDLPGIPELIDQVRSEIPELKGLVHITSSTPAGALVFEHTKILWGEDTFTERIGPVDYRVSIASFFQVNTSANHLVYELVKTMAGPEPPELLLDLYCGGGGLGLYLAGSVSRVVGIEENPDAIHDARLNALGNKLENTSFITGKVEKVLVDFPEKGIPLVTVDPPRCGLNRKVIRRLCRLTPGRIIYVSCNISSLARDTELFREHGYHLRRIGLVDLFPQTPHFEAVSLFTQR